MVNYVVIGENIGPLNPLGIMCSIWRSNWWDFDTNWYYMLFFVFRSLPPLAKKYVLQMLYLDVAITAKAMEEWVLADGISKHRVAIDRLIQLRVITETSDR